MRLQFIAAAVLFATPMAFADTYKIDPGASRIDWKAGKKVGSAHNGSVKVKSGKVETDVKGAVKSLEVIADMKTISNQDLTDEGYNKKLVDHLSNDDFFKVEKFPESKFELTGVTPGAKGEVTVKGNLTMIGKTVPVEFPAKVTTDKNTITGTGTLKIERLKWGLQYGSGSIFKSLTADKIINDHFELTLHLVGKK